MLHDIEKMMGKINEEKELKKMIQLQQVSKTFVSDAGEVHAVKDVNLEIADRDIFGVIGFSGAGKSTLIRCLNLLERPTSGKILMDGIDIMTLSEKELREQRRKIGMIFQHFNLLRSRTVYQNIAFPLKKTSLSKEEKEKKIMSLLELVGLSDKAEAYPSQLSGGQKQRVAIARALANDPKVLLCDEATSALDPQTTKSILDLLLKVNEELGITIILITHEMAVVKDICDKVAIMELGVVVENGLTTDVFVNPQQEVTKKFIDTASNMTKIYELIEQDHPLTHIEQTGKILRLTYSGEAAGHSLICDISVRFQVEVNIIYGNIEVLKNSPVGQLVITIDGDIDTVQYVIDYIKEKEVKLEVIKE